MSIPQSLSKPVFLHNVVCSKTDLNLLECSFSKYTGNINRVQDAIVNCELREYTLNIYVLLPLAIIIIMYCREEYLE